MSEALKECPLCEGNAGIWQTTEAPPPYLAGCLVCGAVITRYDREDAITAWNTRAPDPIRAAARALAEAWEWEVVDMLAAKMKRDGNERSSTLLNRLRDARAALLEALEAGDA